MSQAVLQVVLCWLLCMQYAKQLLNAKSAENFSLVMQQMQQDIPAFHTYMETNWVPYQTSITAYSRKDIQHLSNRTNNRIER